jgi:hypothetical protein
VIVGLGITLFHRGSLKVTTDVLSVMYKLVGDRTHNILRMTFVYINGDGGIGRVIMSGLT